MSFFSRTKKKNAEPVLQDGAPQNADALEIEDDVHENIPQASAAKSYAASIADDNPGLIKVYDPGSQSDIVIAGDVVTGPGGPLELKESLRQLLFATSEREIFYSRSHQNSPQVLSEIKRIETVLGPARIAQPTDMSTLGELYHRSSARSGGRGGARQNDQSAMQRAFISVIASAAKQNVSDVRIVVNQDRAITRYKIDGVYRNIAEMPPQYAFELLSAAFAMADASDPAYQQRQFQGARISNLTTELPAGVQSLRLQFNPLANEGRVLVVRILYSGDGKLLDIAGLGYSEEQVRQIATMSARPVGINVISGPTGSGKSTTLKAILEGVIQKRGDELSVITIEDPPEYVIAAAEQMPVTNAKTQEERAAAFTQAISAGLRSDPEILMIGEVRDKASANLAVEGALTGHPVYASLHANTAMDILSRLRDMGVEDFKVFDATVFSGLIGQRLLRQVCPHCRKPIEEGIAMGDVDDLVAERIERMMEHTPEHARSQLYLPGEGCSECSHGYRGRAVVAEIILPDDNFMDLMRQNRKADARVYWFEKMNGIDLLGSSWMRALEGRVSPVDIENTVALMAPLDAHRHALEYWLGKSGGRT